MYHNNHIFTPGLVLYCRANNISLLILTNNAKVMMNMVIEGVIRYLNTIWSQTFNGI
jgi:hypothetical protein